MSEVGRDFSEVLGEVLVPATLPWEGPDSSYILVSYLIFVAFSVYTE